VGLGRSGGRMVMSGGGSRGSRSGCRTRSRGHCIRRLGALVTGRPRAHQRRHRHPVLHNLVLLVADFFSPCQGMPRAGSASEHPLAITLPRTRNRVATTTQGRRNAFAAVHQLPTSASAARYRPSRCQSPQNEPCATGGGNSVGSGELVVDVDRVVEVAVDAPRS